jgi:hypothetical protein
MTDTLYVMGCMMPGVLNCKIEISIGTEELPDRYVKYIMTPKSWILHRFCKYIETKRGIIGKIAQIILLKMRAPVFIDEDLKLLVKNYLRRDN